MGFGSYDESEQQDQDIGAEEDDSEGVSVHENQHEGEIKFETEADTDELVDRLSQIKRDDKED